MENSPENNFQCLVTFWKYYFPTNFLHFLNNFLSFQRNFISENPLAPTHQHPQKIHHYSHKTHHHTTQKPPKHHHPHHHNNNKKKIEIKERDWEIEGKRDRSGKRDWSLAVATIFCDGDKIVLGWVENEIGLGWWRRERDARLWSRWRRRWGRREKKQEAWPARDLGGGAVWPRRWGNTIWAGQSLAGLAKAWLRWAWRWVLDRVRSVLVFELSLFRCGSIIFFLEMVWR